MALQLNRVDRGDLIRAESWNNLVQALVDLDERLSKLESSGLLSDVPVLLDRFPRGDITVGSLLTLEGRNFLEPTNRNVVKIGPIEVKDFLRGSDDKTLVLSIPNSFTGLPADLQLSVSNNNGESNTLSVRLLPLIEIPKGQVVFTRLWPFQEVAAS